MISTFVTNVLLFGVLAVPFIFVKELSTELLAGTVMLDVGGPVGGGGVVLMVNKLPKLSTWMMRPTSVPSAVRKGRSKGKTVSESNVSPNSSRGTPRERWAATGAKISRP